MSISRLYDFTPSTLAQSGQVDDELNQLVAEVNLKFPTTGGTIASLAITALVSNLLPTDVTYTVGDATHNFKSVSLDNGATDAGSIYFNAGTTAFLKGAAAGDQLNVGGFTSFNPSTNGGANLGTSGLRWGELRLNTNIGSGTPGSNTQYADLLPKAWAFTSSAGSLNAGVGVTVSKTATGEYTYTLKTAMADSNYVVIGTIHGTTVVRIIHSQNTSTTVFVVTCTDSSGVAQDTNHKIVVFGTQ